MAETWLVTGAGRGIGLELCRQLVARGRTVVGTVRHAPAPAELAALPVEVAEVDMGDPASIAALAASLAGRSLDAVVHNAGVGGAGPALGAIEAEEVVRSFRVNALGPLLLTQALLAPLECGQRRLVAAVTSRMGSIEDNGSGGYYAYRASKAALNMMMRSASIDLRSRGITFVVLHPGWVRTDMGGPAAPLSVEASVSGLLGVLEGLRREDSGRFLDHTGAPIPW